MARFSVRTLVAAATLAAVIATPIVADAAAAPTKGELLSSWTQVTATSYGEWNGARQTQERWAGHGFDWTTDYCTLSPDSLVRFDFKLSCARHDFGYRNYRAAGTFDDNKPRLDTMLHEDMKRVCATFGSVKRSICNGVAKTYYEAVKQFGSLAKADKAEIESARARLRAVEAAG